MACNCPPGQKELPPIRIGGKSYCNCTSLILSTSACVPTLFNPCPADDGRAAIERELEENLQKMQRARIAYETEKRRVYGLPPLSSQDTYHFPRMEEVPGPPLNLPSRADQKANIFNTAFDPTKRKIFVLVIAGFLLFLALVNYK